MAAPAFLHVGRFQRPAGTPSAWRADSASDQTAAPASKSRTEPGQHRFCFRGPGRISGGKAAFSPVIMAKRRLVRPRMDL